MRLFFAIDFPPETRRALAVYGEQLRNLLPGARFTREDLIHLTLYFVGEQSPGQAAMLARLLHEPVPSFPSPFTLHTGGLGAFRSGRGHTLWIGLSPNPSLRLLWAALLRRLTDTGYPPPGGRFHPHVTLAREARLDGPITEVESLCPLPPMEIPVMSVTLSESLRRDGRLHYQPLDVLSL